MIEQSVVIHRPLFDVFDYLMDVERFWEWAPYFLHTEVVDRDGKGWPTRFKARVGPSWDLSYETEVSISDVKRGRSISYHSGEPPQVATYRVDPAPVGTILTAHHNPWAMLGLTTLQSPLDIFGMDYLNQALSNAKRKLESRPPSSRPVVFLSYRRKLAEYVAGRIVEIVSREFGDTSVFRDLSTISAGQDADEAVIAGLSECAAVIVLIDDQWLEAFEKKRQADEKDYVLLEITNALDLEKLIVPVALQTVDTEQVRERLPTEIETLRDMQWQRLRYDPDFTSDMHRVVQAIWGEVMKGGPSHKDEPRRLAPARPDQPAWAQVLSGAMESWMEISRIVSSSLESWQRRTDGRNYP